jgi:hypothetical protein
MGKSRLGTFRKYFFTVQQMLIETLLCIKFYPEFEAVGMSKTAHFLL